MKSLVHITQIYAEYKTVRYGELEITHLLKKSYRRQPTVTEQSNFVCCKDESVESYVYHRLYPKA